jgi:predicted transcriptional regulator
MPRSPTRHCQKCLGTGREPLPPELLHAHLRLQKGDVTANEYREELDWTVTHGACCNRLNALVQAGLAERVQRNLVRGREFVYRVREEDAT